ncbi:UNVERIFIED_CONTAM: hypothetical protein GTU68_015239 [Idotea baltica]|nr:hypothetical protein [Idotea baltica]
MCQVLIESQTASVPLLVRRPPIISDNSTRSVVVSEGTPVRLECYAGGVPIPKVSWRRENNALLPTGGSVFSGNELQIPSIRKEDRGTYYCIAENGVGRGARRNINVEVEFKPVVSTQKPVVYQALLFDAILECRVESYPPAAISWIFRSETLVNNQHYVMSQFATADEFTDTTLRVRSIEKRQYGNYTCRANNKLGGYEATIVL